MCSNELGDPMLNTLRITLKQNRRERDEEIIAIHPILPDDVISVPEWRMTKRRSQRVSMRDKHRETVRRKKMRQTGWCRKAGDLKCIPLILSPRVLSCDASLRRNPIISFSSHSF